MTEQELCRAAIAMLDRSYSPYSHFPVGAALECSDGTVFTGCNIETPPTVSPSVPNAPPSSRPSARAIGISNASSSLGRARTTASPAAPAGR